MANVSCPQQNPYSGRIKFYGRMTSIARVAKLRQLPTIIARFGDWCITTRGIDYLPRLYCIEKTRLDELDWIQHMQSKPWVDMIVFKRVFETAKRFVKRGII